MRVLLLGSEGFPRAVEVQPDGAVSVGAEEDGAHGHHVEPQRMRELAMGEGTGATDKIWLARVERVAASEASTDAVATAAVVIEVGGARVRVERGVDLDTPAAVLELMGVRGGR